MLWVRKAKAYWNSSQPTRLQAAIKHEDENQEVGGGKSEFLFRGAFADTVGVQMKNLMWL